MIKSALTGAMVALATPLTKDRALDRPAVARLIERCLRAGITAISPTGSTGEGPHLPRLLRHELLAEVVRVVARRVPVIVGIAQSCIEDAQKDIADAVAAGATHVLVAPPFYYPMTPKAIERFFQTLAETSEVPLLIYNIPQMTKNAVPPDVVGRLAKHANIVGIKDSSRDFEYFMAVAHEVRGKDGFSLLTGTDTMLVPSLVMGGDGAIAASANLVPELGAGICRAMEDGDITEARRLQDILIRVVLASRRGSFPAGWKAALQWAGLCEAWTMPPTFPLDENDSRALGETMKGLLT